MLLNRKTTVLIALFIGVWLAMLAHWLFDHISGHWPLSGEEIHVLTEWLLCTGLLSAISFSLLRHGRSVDQIVAERTAALQETHRMLQSELLERRQAQDELIISEQRCQDSIEISGECIWEFDREGKLVYLTTSFERIFGYPAESALGMDWSSFVASEDREEMQRSFDEAVDRREALQGYVCRALKLDGSEFRMRCNVLPLWDGEGQLSGFRGASRDISEEFKLREDRERIYQLLQHSKDYVGMVSSDGRILYANPAIMNLNGAELYESHGQQIWPQLTDIMPQEVWEFHRDVIFPTVLREGYWNSELEQIDQSSGREIILDVSIFAICDPEDPESLCFATIQRDITASRRMQQEMMQLRALLENTEDCVGTSDLEGHLKYINPSYMQLIGATSSEEMRGRHLSSFMTPEYYEQLRETILPAVDRLGRWRGEVERVNMSTGELQIMDLSILLVRNETSNEPMCYATVQRDITAFKLAEKKLSDYARELEQNSIELKRALEESRCAAQVKSDFLATMSHEIRTPMNGVIGMVQLLLETELSSDQRDFAHTLDSSAQSLLRIINDILDFSRIEAGKLELEQVDFPIAEVLEDVAGLIFPDADEKHVRLICSVDARLPHYLRGDPMRLRQVLTNLAGNAVKFTEQGRICLRAVLEAEAAETLQLRFEVEDSGIGIPQAKMEKLFDPFWQVDASTTRRYGGSGLGLAISRNLVRLMGGEIRAESRLGYGSTFSFTVPLSRSAVRDHDLEDAAARVHGMRVLLGPLPESEGSVLRGYLQQWGVSWSDCSLQELDALALAAKQEARPPEAAIVLLEQFADAEGHCPLLPAGIPLILLAGRSLRDEMGCARGHRLLRLPLRRDQLLRSLAQLRGESGVVQSCSIELPPAPETASAPQVSAEQQNVAVGGANILLAEDNLVNQKVASRMLEKSGHRVRIAANGQEALDLLHRESFDLVLMDCQMPLMDGFEATAAIRACGKGWARIPVIAMTANAMRGDRERCLAAGMDDYLSKPVNTQELLDAVGRALARRVASAVRA